MKIEIIRSEGLAALSYFISSKDMAVVIDPRRDVEIYLNLSEAYGSEIQYILETHRNEDYIIGSLELQAQIPNARIGHSNATQFMYGEDNLEDDEILKVGDIRIQCLQTPGHTDDSISYVFSDPSVSDDSLVAFTGDTLFVNEVGRTDLVDSKKTELMARKLYQSLHEKLTTIGDWVIIYPGHGEGSVCGGNIGSREFSTIGYEKRNNSWLKMSEEEFVTRKKNQKLTLASYFKHCEKMNTEGPPLLSELTPPKLLDVNSFESMMRLPNHIVIDTRAAYIFRQFHIPDSVSLDIDHMGRFAAWVLNPEDSFLFVLQQVRDLSRARAIFHRVGLDNIIGYLHTGMDSWVNANKKVRSLHQYSLDDLKRELKEGKVKIIDVRQPHEFEQMHIPDSLVSPLTDIDTMTLEPIIPIVIMCPSGFRSTTGASLLLRKGIKDVIVPLEGLKTWISRGYPLESD